jgi:TPP-dependent pyruvate/acetoin dehydrogenase alpha subunit
MPSEAREGELYLGLYRQMVLIRRFEDEVQRLFLRGEIYGSTHLCIGQEAISAGVCSAVSGEDWVAATYRGHGHCLALGTTPRALLAELMGRSTGVCGGRAGSMNVVDREHRLLGCFGIVGGSMAAATGAALAARGTGAAAIAFFGDGAANQAYFHECLNFAQVRSLPAVFVCENNQYGEYTPTDAVTPGGIVARPRAMGIVAEEVDGNDLWAMREAGQWALARARAGEGPVFLEADTYRFSDHGRGDPIDYRPEGEVERWRERDPLALAAQRLVGDYGIEAERLGRLAAAVEGELRELATAVRADPFPQPGAPVSEFKEPREAA